MNIAKARKLVYARSGGACEIQILGSCTYRATDWHHRKSRSQGGLWTPANGLHLCHADHMLITDTREEFYDKGWLVKSWQNPLEVPFEHWQWGPVRIDDAGDYHLQLPEEVF